MIPAMNGVLLGFEIATGIFVFLNILLFILPRMRMPLRVWWYLLVETQKALPPDLKEYLLRRGMKRLSKAKSISP
jgi:hypothetical protein